MTRQMTLDACEQSAGFDQTALQTGSALGNAADLVATVIRGKKAQETALAILSEFPSLKRLANAGIGELASIPGMSKKKAISLKSAIELGRAMVGEKLERGKSFTSSYAVYEHYHPLFAGKEKEEFHMLLLDQKNRVLGSVLVGVGSINRCPITPQEIFAPALREKAVRLLLLHNHPSGNPEPSQDDRTLTQKLQQMAQLLGFEIIDHIVIGDGNYVSFADRGWI